MPKDKEGNQLTFKEYMARWKTGCETLTPEQSNRIQFRGTLITMLGIICGIIISILGYQTLWWLSLILLGALFNTWVALVGQNAQRKFLKKLNKDSVVMLDGEQKGMSDIAAKIGAYLEDEE